MKLKIRYDDTFQTIDLDATATQQMWVSLSLQGENLTDSEKEKRIQEAFDEQYNKPEYNNWHKHNRHTGTSKAQPGKDEDEEDLDSSEPLMDEAMDDRIFRRDELEREEKESYEDICQWVRTACGKKQNWADAFIAVRLDGMSVNDYAASIGVKDASTISWYLIRAEKKLKEKYPERQI